MSRLVKDSVLKTLIRMAIPMLGATFAMNAYNLTDTWFVSRLGTDPLAAMSFTFPIVMFLRFVLRGLGTGVMTSVAHALGRKKQETAAFLTTHAIILDLILAFILTLVGLLTIKPLFARLGAFGPILLLTEEYMQVWYWGLIIISVQMIIVDIIIGTGSAKTASCLVVGGTFLNFILDPLLIFGIGFFPKLGIRGAALATVISQAFILIIGVYLLGRKYHLLAYGSFWGKRIFSSWRTILHIGVPSTLSSILNPISAAIIIKIVADFGAEAVAACGVASRIEMFAFMVPMTIGISLVPFTAQNYGAHRFDRIQVARRGTLIFALTFGFFMAILFLFIAPFLGSFFSTNPKVIEILVRYIYITCFGYGFLEAHRYSGFYMTGIHKPISAAILNLIRVCAFLIPFSYLGSWVLGLQGVFWGRLFTDLLAGVLAIVWSGRILNQTSDKTTVKTASFLETDSI